MPIPRRNKSGDCSAGRRCAGASAPHETRAVGAPSGRLRQSAPHEPDRSRPGYPGDLEREITLRDGARVRVRPIRADDQARLIELYDRLSQHTAYQRFFTVMRRLPPGWAKILATVNYRRQLALVAEPQGPHGVELVGVSRPL